jgi:thiamine-phosphate diphosphorylase
VPADALKARPLLAANAAIRKAACLPRLCLVTPEPGDASFLDGLRASLAAGVRLVQFRAKATPDVLRRELAVRAVELCHANGALCLINGDADLVRESGADGLHLGAAQLRRSLRRELPHGLLLSAACHDATEIAAANRLRVDMGLLGPVAETASHPGALPLGGGCAAQLIATADFPVYALGGQSPATLTAALDAGCQGIAAIRGLWMPRQELPDARLRLLCEAGAQA